MFRKTVRELQKPATALFKAPVKLPIRHMSFSKTYNTPSSSLIHNNLLRKKCKTGNHFFRQFSSDANKNSAVIVKLKNGSEAHITAVITTMRSVEALLYKNPIAFYELVMKSRNPEHTMYGNMQNVVSEWALIDSGGEMHSLVRDIILSAVNGDGIEDMYLSNPVLNNQDSAENNISQKFG